MGKNEMSRDSEIISSEGDLKTIFRILLREQYLGAKVLFLECLSYYSYYDLFYSDKKKLLRGVSVTKLSLERGLGRRIMWKG